MKRYHSMPFGAEVLSDGRIRFRLWAPAAKTVEIQLEENLVLAMQPAQNGWYELITNQAQLGSLYQYRINGELSVPDPASRFNPGDVHGPSQVIDPCSFQWDDKDWHGRSWKEAVIYELHVGAFSLAGTFKAVEEKLDYLRELGITAIELMPVADFPGQRNWGYDGVLPFAPDSSYGHPDDLKRLIQAAHQRGLMMFLDVVYNHFGPEGNYLHCYAPQFFTERHHTPWGAAINFDDKFSRTVRDFFIHNALYWLEEFHFDGLRFDAVHAIKDDSQPDILQELAQAVRQRFASERQVHLVLENNHNAAHYLKRDKSFYYTAQWNDDIHHCLHVLLTGEADGYYADYAKQPITQLGRCLVEGFAYQGEASRFHEDQPRGEPSASLPSTAFVSFLQNHDQVGNRAFGERLSHLINTEPLRAASAIMLLSPQIPLLFMGEEFAATTPFLFFCDFHAELAQAVTQGRRNEFARFKKFADSEVRAQIPDPNDIKTFLSSKLQWNWLDNAQTNYWHTFYQELLILRQKKIVPRLNDIQGAQAHFFGEKALQVVWNLSSGSQLILTANLGSTPVKLNKFPPGELLYSLAWSQHITTLPAWSVGLNFAKVIRSVKSFVG